MERVYSLAVSCDDFLFQKMMGIKIDIKGFRRQILEGFTIVIANHQSWNDIFVLQHLFNRRAPVLKFLVKRELIYLPIVGLICWAYGYPFLKRNSHRGVLVENGKTKKDLIVVEKALDRFIRYPATIVNFVEGTRFSPVKAEQMNSPHDFLMRPKAGGLTTIIEILGDRIQTILDLTIVYDCDYPNFWNFLCGKCPSVIVRVTEYSSEKMPQMRDYESVSEWINGVWAQKDLEVKSLRQTLGRSS